MKEAGTDALGALRWGLRRYRVLFLACLVLGAVLAPFAVSRVAKPADAEALVLTQRLDMDLTALPRYGEAVFDNGQVAQAVAARIGDGGDVGDVVPDKVSLVAEQDSIVYQVVGHDPDPRTAAEIANVAAEAFVEALNAPGVGVGAFALLSPAEPPAAPAGGLSAWLAIPVGLGTGLILGLAAVSVLLATRRPVIDAVGVEEATGVPALGVVTVLRPRRGTALRPEDFRGLVPVCRRLLALELPTVVLASRSRDQGLRRQLSVALSEVLGRVRNVRLTGPDELRPSGAEGNGGKRPDQTQQIRSGTGKAAGITVVDSTDPLELVQPPELTAAVLVAPEGVSSAALRGAVLDHLGGSAEAGVLLVRHGRHRLPRLKTSKKDAPQASKADDTRLTKAEK